MDSLVELSNSLSQLNSDVTLRLVRQAIRQGTSANLLLAALAKGMEEVGKKYEQSEYFLSELVFAGEIMKSALQELKPYLEVEHSKEIGTIVVGTVRGDLHDIGKNIFITFASSAGFKIVDLGVDVSPELFESKVKEVKPDVVGMSALMSTTHAHMKEVIDLLRRSGLRDSVKIIIGGASVSERLAREIGADEAVTDAILGVQICKQWISPAQRTESDSQGSYP